MTAANALEISGLVKRYGRRAALDGLDLSVPAGSLYGLVGSNGAGKTTTLGIAAGLIRASAGHVSVLGLGPFDAARHHGRLAMLPQDCEFPRYARVADVLSYYARLQGMPAGAIHHHVSELLEWVHLSDRRRAPLRTLSHGMRRRVMIAQAFLGHPDLILLDEPLSGLDPREVINIRGILRRRRTEQTVVISSHNLDEIERMCDRVAFIEKGRLVRGDAIDAVTSRHRVIRVVLESAPVELDALTQALPHVALSYDPESRCLTCTDESGTRSVSELNRVVLGALLSAGLGILELARGDGLEAAYLRHANAG